MKIKLFKTGILSLSTLVLFACSNIDDRLNVKNSWCAEEEEPKTIEILELSSDAMFVYNGSKVTDLLPEGQQKLQELILILQDDYTSISQITITGHTDRIGSDNYNDKLGLDRATAVKAYLIDHGLDATYIIETKGKREPVTSSCVGNKATAELKACLAPDRRVVLDIEGIKE
ncbi:OmpA family protein [Zophobihabitans entericus]|uniref:OmpA family protein n=1 Tax=Zophobihabitans entericus TaxID=1635327 RepID=A0A6G9IDX1_9GAMM|nr:OmpA family protein [Zophobihabitans entericus]QIQ22012.1 OmpA family protein [Zophobihabitans entericus]